MEFRFVRSRLGICRLFLVVAAVFALIIGILFLGYGVYQDIKEMKK